MLRKYAHIFQNPRMRTSSWTTPVRPLQGQKFPRECWSFGRKRKSAQTYKWLQPTLENGSLLYATKKSVKGWTLTKACYEGPCATQTGSLNHYLQDDLTAVGAEANDIIAMCTSQTPVSSKQTALEEDPLNIQEPQEDPGNIHSDNENLSGCRETRPLTELEKEEIKSLFQKKSRIMCSLYSKMCARNWVPAWLCEN